MVSDFFLQLDIYSPLGVAILVVAGFLVGFVNTIAGSGTIITYSVFMAFGLPPTLANGTIRMGVIMQTLASSLSFNRQKVLDITKGLLLGLPTVIGSVIGAQTASQINQEVFKYILVVVMFFMLLLLFLNPKRWIEGKLSVSRKKPSGLQYFVFLLIGFYGGFIHIGVGIFLLAALVLVSGYDLVKANALKVFIVLLYSPFALAVYLYNDQVHYGMALISSVGNVFGGVLASRLAVSWGARFVHWFLLVIIVLFIAKILGLF